MSKSTIDHCKDLLAENAKLRAEREFDQRNAAASQRESALLLDKCDELQAQVAFLIRQVDGIRGFLFDREPEPEPENFFTWQEKQIKLRKGEQYVGTIVTADGTRNHHVVLLPGELSGVIWDVAKEWAASIGGELPDRGESALLFATMKDEFDEALHWTREAHASRSGYAWCQDFDGGIQNAYSFCYKLYARAIRRIPITSREPQQ